MHGDRRSLLYGLIGGAIILAGAGWGAYDDLNGQMTAVRAELTAVQVNAQRLEGKVDTLDARLGGKLDVLLERKNPSAKQ